MATITTEEAAAKLGVRVDEIYRLIRCGRLKAIKQTERPRGQNAKRWMVDAEDVEARMLKRGRDGRFSRP